MRLRRNLFLFDADGGGAGGDPAPPAPKPDPAPEKTFTQAELDKIVQDRLARAKREEPADYAELKAKAAELDTIRESQKTELEKAQDAAKKAEQEAARAVKAANKRLAEAAVLAEAATQNAVRPEHLSKLLDMNSVTVGDDGQVTGAQEAVKAFLEANPEYVGKSRPAGPVDQGARGPGNPGQLTREDLKTMTPEEIVKAQNEGRTDELLGVQR